MLVFAYRADPFWSMMLRSGLTPNTLFLWHHCQAQYCSDGLAILFSWQKKYFSLHSHTNIQRSSVFNQWTPRSLTEQSLLVLLISLCSFSKFWIITQNWIYSHTMFLGTIKQSISDTVRRFSVFFGFSSKFRPPFLKNIKCNVVVTWEEFAARFVLSLIRLAYIDYP